MKLERGAWVFLSDFGGSFCVDLGAWLLSRTTVGYAETQAITVSFGGMARVIRVNSVIAHHLVLSGHGHWLSNDPRGSGSVETRLEKLRDLGPVHRGRRVDQPSTEAIKAFYREADERLEHPVLWLAEPARLTIAEAVERVVRERGYTAWGCAILADHAHLVLRVHRDSGHAMWDHIAVATRGALREAGLVPASHPVWSSRPYVVFKTDVPSVYRAIGYVADNPEKHGLPRQVYPWVARYDGWPHRARGAR